MTEILGTVYNGMFVLLLLSVIAALLRTPLVKGWFGEAQSALAQELLLDKAIYTAINDITLPTANGTTQIDHVVVSRYGIFVIETKNMKGWIYGSEKGATWTQNLYGRKYRFQNPLHQNYRHLRALAEFLKLDDSHFHSVVMFWGDVTLKNPLPPNVLTHGYASYIKSKQRVVFTDEEVTTIISAIQTGRLPRTWATRTAHVESLKARHSSTDTCPKCSSPLVLRTVKSGEKAGKQFYGCSTFPACRYMQWG
ncbi:MAG: NERD domain-containing protein [Pseudomonas sagittaria]|nr:NERD domain-containing protein [Pseudomonas sagittaria]